VCYIVVLAEGRKTKVSLCLIDLYKVNGFFTVILVDPSDQPYSRPP
jgi:hypothetical protein